MKLIIKNSDSFEGVESGERVYYLREPKPLTEAKKCLDLVEEFERMFDTTLINTEDYELEGEDWFTSEEIEKFLEEKYEKTYDYFGVLARSGEWISTKELIKEMGKLGHTGMVSQSLSGIRSGNTKSYRSRDKEPLDEDEWNNDEWQQYYRIKPKYLKLLREALESDEE
jgi:hypothetical protein